MPSLDPLRRAGTSCSPSEIIRDIIAGKLLTTPKVKILPYDYEQEFQMLKAQKHLAKAIMQMQAHKPKAPRKTK